MPTASTFPARQDRLRALMDTQNVSFLLVTHLPNVRYLTGFTGSAGMVVVGRDWTNLWVDPRYTLQAQDEVRDAHVFVEKNGILRGVANWLRKSGIKKAAFEASSLNCSQFAALRKETGTLLKLKPMNNLVEELRVEKDDGEIEAIRGAGKLTAEVFEELLPLVRPGVSEKDLAAEVDYRMRRKGAEGVAFETIIASGPRSALPHARPSPKLLHENELVIIDLGAILGGYAADMTRTVYTGKPTRRVLKLRAAVLHAQAEAVGLVREGSSVGGLDRTARRVLASQGLARFFTHSTGHGVGLEIHERPRIAKGEKVRLKSRSVVTIEPGIYIEGFGGVRIEDTVLVTAEGAENLTPASKDRWVMV